MTQLLPSPEHYLQNLITMQSPDAKKLIDKGRLAPDSILLKVIQSRLSKPDCRDGYILDGFPRTISQAIGFENIMQKSSLDLDFAINLEAEENELVERLIKRGKDSGRSDDKIDIIRKRQKIYWEETAPLLDFYNKRGLLITVDGIGDIDIITRRIFKVLK